MYFSIKSAIECLRPAVVVLIAPVLKIGEVCDAVLAYVLPHRTQHVVLQFFRFRYHQAHPFITIPLTKLLGKQSDDELGHALPRLDAVELLLCGAKPE